MGFDLTPEERDEFEEWAKFQREHNIKGMAESAFVLSIAPKEFDIEFAMQLGAAILMEKPLLLIVRPGQEIPDKLRQVADEVLEISMDDVDLGSKIVADKIHGFMKEKGIA